MKKLYEKIDSRKRAITHKKKNIKTDWENIKETLTSNTGMSISALSGLVIGFLFLPKKAKLLRLILKAYTVATTAKQLVELLPHASKPKKAAHYRKDVH